MKVSLRDQVVGILLLAILSITWACSPNTPDAFAADKSKSSTSLKPRSKTTFVPAPFPTARDPISWPFSTSSIWNMPLGKGAVLTPALLPPVDGPVVTSDENILILTPSAPLVDVFASDAEWDARRSRCGEAQTNNVLYQVPIPPEFRTDPGFEGDTPNHPGAVLMADGRTVRQTQPLHRCPAGFAVTKYDYDSVDLFSDGRLGAHGGSGLSSIGGAIRVGELKPGGAIRHALKFELNAAALLAFTAADPTPGYRWPADRADGYAPTKYRGQNPLLEMGTLLALPDTFDVESLSTEPARILGRALRDYGAYIVDDTAWPVYSFATEWGPAGRVNDEMVKQYGHRFGPNQTANCTTTTPDCLWAKDLTKLITSFSVVTNASEADPGGPGARKTFCAPALNPEDVRPDTCPPVPVIQPPSTAVPSTKVATATAKQATTAGKRTTSTRRPKKTTSTTKARTS